MQLELSVGLGLWRAQELRTPRGLLDLVSAGEGRNYGVSRDARDQSKVRTVDEGAGSVYAVSYDLRAL